MPDKFESQRNNLQSPLDGGFAVTPDNSTALTRTTRAIWVGGAGNVVAVLAGAGAETVTLVGVAAGTLLPIRADYIRATSTTATSIVGLD